MSKLKQSTKAEFVKYKGADVVECAHCKWCGEYRGIKLHDFGSGYVPCCPICACDELKGCDG